VPKKVPTFQKTENFELFFFGKIMISFSGYFLHSL
jgi:hypothetical protein